MSRILKILFFSTKRYSKIFSFFVIRYLLRIISANIIYYGFIDMNIIYHHAIYCIRETGSPVYLCLTLTYPTVFIYTVLLQEAFVSVLYCISMFNSIYCLSVLAVHELHGRRYHAKIKVNVLALIAFFNDSAPGHWSSSVLSRSSENHSYYSKKQPQKIENSHHRPLSTSNSTYSYF